MNSRRNDDFHFYNDFYKDLYVDEKIAFETMVSVSSNFVDSYIIGLIYKAEYDGIPYRQSELEGLLLRQREDADELIDLNLENIRKKIYSLHEIGYIYTDMGGDLRLDEAGKLFVEFNPKLYD